MSNSGEVEAKAPTLEHLPAPEIKAPIDQPEAAAAEEKQPVEGKNKEKAPNEKKPKPPAHPPYFMMIKEAITALNEKGGSSPYAIGKYVEEKYKAVLPANFLKILGLQLKNSVAKGKLIKVKASYKLSAAGKREKGKTATKAARANAGKRKELKKSKPKTKAVRKIDNRAASKTTTDAPAVTTTKARRAKKSAPAKPKLLKSIKSPAVRTAKKATS